MGGWEGVGNGGGKESKVLPPACRALLATGPGLSPPPCFGLPMPPCFLAFLPCLQHCLGPLTVTWRSLQATSLAPLSYSPSPTLLSNSCLPCDKVLNNTCPACGLRKGKAKCGLFTVLPQRPCTGPGSETALQGYPVGPRGHPPPKAGTLACAWAGRSLAPWAPAPSQGDPVHTPGKRHTAGNTHPVTSCSV